jgi:penicillin-binding protein 1B
MNVLQVGELYGNFASGGFHTTPSAVIAVLDEANTPISRYPLQTRQSINSRANEQLLEAMKITMSKGTGKRSSLSGRGVAGKTGTSNDFRDSWFAGFDAATLAVIWVGHDNNTPTGLTGSSGAMRVWDGFMKSSRIAPLASANALPTPDLEDALTLTELEYSTGFATAPSCSPEQDRVNLLVPANAEIETKPGCRITNRFGDRLRRWFRPD